MNNLKIRNDYQIYSKWITISCFIGVLLSLYALYVEIRIEIEDDYQAMCDINEKISCTKVVSSKYGRGFGFLGYIFGNDSIMNQRNPIFGIIAYTLIALLSYTNNVIAVQIQFYICVLSNFMSIYLAYLLFIIDSLCVICVSTYIVNFINLILSWKYLKLLNENENNLIKND